MFASDGVEEPNRKIFDAYQESMRKSSDLGEPADSAEFSQEKPVGEPTGSAYDETAGGSVS